jgi:hypothetical protein
MKTFDNTALYRITGPAPMDNLIEKGNKKPPINPTPRLHLRVMWLQVTDVQGYPDKGYYKTRWLMGL